ncbi:MAG TPA: hypothetical protein VJN18_06450 [Polyangiaceae bacterium]|nr:hypothetical protein [Polyangiaceae bacterium]
MTVALTNKSRQLLIVRLNSGKSLYLAPRERSPLLDGIEVGDNADIAKMSGRGLISIEQVDRSGGP